MRRNFSKYNAKKTEVDGIIFDSKKEAERYRYLRQLEMDGVVRDLQRQVKYVLIPAQREPDRIGKRSGIIRGRTIEKECSYIADFVYTDEFGISHVEDVKGMRDGAVYSLFKVKKKMMLFFYGIRVEEV